MYSNYGDLRSSYVIIGLDLYNSTHLSHNSP